MSKKKKYYTVWKGHNTGVFETWEDCKAQIKNFKGAQYKSFTSFEAAKKHTRKALRSILANLKPLKVNCQKNS